MERIGSIALAFVVLAGISFERLTDSWTHPPGVSAPYSINRVPFAVCDATVYFTASFLSETGLYAVSSSGLQTIANLNTTVPGTSETFEAAEFPSCAAGRVMFLGRQTNAPIGAGRSVYEVKELGVTSLLAEGLVVGGREVQSFNRLAVGDSGLGLIAALVPSSVAQGVIFAPFGGTPSLVADESTVMPGQVDEVDVFSQPVWSREGLVFRAVTNMDIGLYLWSENAGLSVLADTSTPTPEGGTFTTFGGVASLDEGVVFEAGYPGGFGLFRWSHGQIEPFVVPGDALSNGDVITAAGLPVGSGRLLSFTARSIQHPTDAIWLLPPQGEALRLLGVGDSIDGREVDQILSAANDGDVALLVDSRDDPRIQIIYRGSPGSTADIPISPIGLTLFAFALTAAGLLLLRS